MAGETTIHKLKALVAGHTRAIAMVLGSGFVSLWTLLRFSNTASIYDLVTQQVLAHSWLHGYTGQVPLGPTNYLLKVFLLYMPVDVLPGSPRLKLVVLTLLINIATFLLIFLAIEKILKEFGIAGKFFVGSAMVWLAMIAGSVFWIQFSNSRNLEVAGGMFLVLAALRFLRQPTRRSVVWLASLASILFFADSLQIYMVGLPLIAYGLVLAGIKKIRWPRALLLVTILAAGAVAARLITSVVAHLLNLDIGQAATGINLPLSNLGPSLSGAGYSTLNQLNGGLDGGIIRERANLIFLGLGLAAFAVAAWRRLVPRKLVLLVGLVLVCDEAVYIVSGQALGGGTSRYLITLAPTCALAFGALDRAFRPGKLAYGLVSIAVLINALFLGRAFLHVWNPNFPVDSHLNATANYLNARHYGYALASMDTATPLAYYDGVKQTMLFPTACLNNRLVHANAFRNTAAITRDRGTQSLVPLILDQTEIKNVPNVCDQQSIIVQFGQPVGTDKTSDGSVVLLYPPQTLAALY